jgi:hypothetical protein
MTQITAERIAADSLAGAGLITQITEELYGYFFQKAVPDSSVICEICG